MKIEEEIQSINEKIEEQIDIGDQGFPISNANAPDVFLESESSAEALKDRNLFELNSEHPMRNPKSDFDDFFSHGDNSNVNAPDSFF